MTAGIVISEIKNLTTHMDILNPKTGLSIEVSDFGKSDIVFHATFTPRIDHLIYVSGQMLMAQKVIKFEATGRVTEVMPGKNKRNRIKIFLQQYDQRAWESFLKFMLTKQQHADQVFSSVKGDDEG